MRYLMAFAVLLLAFVQGAAQINPGEHALYNGRMDDAYRIYRLAYDASVTPENAFGLAFSTAGGFAQDPLYKNYIARTGLVGLPADGITWMRSIILRSMHLFIVKPGALPFIWQEARAVLDESLYRRLEESVTVLSNAENYPELSIQLDWSRLGAFLGMVREYKPGKTNVQAIDVIGIRGFLSMAAAAYLMLSATDLGCSLYDFRTKVAAKGAYGWYNPFADKDFTNFGRPMEDRTNRFRKASIYLDKGLRDLEIFFKAGAEDKSPMFTRMFPYLQKVDARKFSIAAKKLYGTLNGTYADISPEIGLQWPRVSLGRFLAYAPSLRDLIYELDAQGQPVLYNRQYRRVTKPQAGLSYFIRFPGRALGGLFAVNPPWMPEYTLLTTSYREGWSPFDHVATGGAPAGTNLAYLSNSIKNADSAKK